MPRQCHRSQILTTIRIFSTLTLSKSGSRPEPGVKKKPGWTHIHAWDAQSGKVKYGGQKARRNHGGEGDPGEQVVEAFEGHRGHLDGVHHPRVDLKEAFLAKHVFGHVQQTGRRQFGHRANRTTKTEGVRVHRFNVIQSDVDITCSCCCLRLWW